MGRTRVVDGAQLERDYVVGGGGLGASRSDRPHRRCSVPRGARHTPRGGLAPPARRVRRAPEGRREPRAKPSPFRPPQAGSVDESVSSAQESPGPPPRMNRAAHHRAPRRYRRRPLRTSRGAGAPRVTNALDRGTWTASRSDSERPGPALGWHQPEGKEPHLTGLRRVVLHRAAGSVLPAVVRMPAYAYRRQFDAPRCGYSIPQLERSSGRDECPPREQEPESSGRSRRIRTSRWQSTGHGGSRRSRGWCARAGEPARRVQRG